MDLTLPEDCRVPAAAPYRPGENANGKLTEHIPPSGAGNRQRRTCRVRHRSTSLLSRLLASKPRPATGASLLPAVARSRRSARRSERGG